jgi:hypothetical protein
MPFDPMWRLREIIRKNEREKMAFAGSDFRSPRVALHAECDRRFARKKICGSDLAHRHFAT